MMIEEKSQLTEEQLVVAREAEKKFNNILNGIGLSTPVDYIFLDFAIQKSRMALKNLDDKLHFLFHTCSKTEMEAGDRLFPNSMFLEKCSYRHFNVEKQQTEDVEELIMWVLQPSEQWKTRNILPFTDFHLYFNEVIKPLYDYSAEDIYRILDDRKEEFFFISHGSRTSSESKRIITLFISKDHIIVFHFDFVDVEKIPKSEKFMSRWISLFHPICLQEIHEYAIFERAKFQLVAPVSVEEQPIHKIGSMNFSTQGLDYVEDMECVNCSS